MINLCRDSSVSLQFDDNIEINCVLALSSVAAQRQAEEWQVKQEPNTDLDDGYGLCQTVPSQIRIVTPASELLRNLPTPTRGEVSLITHANCGGVGEESIGDTSRQRDQHIVGDTSRQPDRQITSGASIQPDRYLTNDAIRQPDRRITDVSCGEMRGFEAKQETICKAASALYDRLEWATQELRHSTNIDASIQLCQLIKTSADAIVSLKQAENSNN